MSEKDKNEEMKSNRVAIRSCVVYVYDLGVLFIIECSLVLI